ncbi:hypothetical protein BH18ACT17_BH18ACT17_09240 [soil metagenome]
MTQAMSLLTNALVPAASDSAAHPARSPAPTKGANTAEVIMTMVDGELVHVEPQAVG